MPRLPDLDSPAHIKHVRIQLATIAVRICSYCTRTNCGGDSVPASKPAAPPIRLRHKFGVGYVVTPSSVM